MSEKPEKSKGERHSVSEAKEVKTIISDKAFAQLDQEARNSEISRSEVVRHIIYDHQKKQQSQSKTE
jgi:hypothetical protein